MCKLVIFKQEAVVTELGCDFVIYGSWDMGGNELLLLYREKSVAVYAYDRAFRPDCFQGLFHTTASASDIVAVNGTAEIIV